MAPAPETPNLGPLARLGEFIRHDPFGGLGALVGPEAAAFQRMLPERLARFLVRHPQPIHVLLNAAFSRPAIQGAAGAQRALRPFLRSGETLEPGLNLAIGSRPAITVPAHEALHTAYFLKGLPGHPPYKYLPLLEAARRSSMPPPWTRQVQPTIPEDIIEWMAENVVKSELKRKGLLDLFR